MGIRAFVSESPLRIPYLQALTTLRKADFLLVPGTDDPTYTASKIYPYRGEPTLTCSFHEEKYRRKCGPHDFSGRGRSFLQQQGDRGNRAGTRFKVAGSRERLPYTPCTNWNYFQRYTAREMTRQQCELFDQALAPVTELPISSASLLQ